MGYGRMSMSNLEGVLLSDYLLVQCISRGEMADVYYARQQSLGNDEVAVKIYRSHNAQQAAFRDYFMIEEEKIGQLDHANILPLLEFGEGDRLVYTVTPYMVGGTLNDLLRRAGGSVSVVQALPLLQQLCSAVQYAHSRLVIHGNIQPSNIFVAPDGRMLLSDFGIVHGYPNRQLSLSHTSMGWGMRTMEECTIPLQASGMMSQANDIYALGVLLFRMLTGQLPFIGQTLMRVPGISEAVADVLSRALQKQATDRFASAEALSQAFLVAVTSPPSASPAVVSKPVRLLSPVSATAFHPINSQTPDEMPFVAKGDFMSKQHFWSVEPIEWSPLPPVQGAALPLSADEYLRNTPVAAVPVRTPVQAMEAPTAANIPMTPVPPEPPVVPPASPMQEESVQTVNPECYSWNARLSKVLPIIVVIVLVLGLLVAFLSSFFYPA